MRKRFACCVIAVLTCCSTAVLAGSRRTEIGRHDRIAGPHGGARGKVLTPEGKPAVGTPVWMLRDDVIVARGTTDRSGAFILPAQAFGSAIVAHPRKAAIVWVSTYGCNGGIYALRARRQAIVQGTVVDPAGKPVAGAVVAARLIGGDTGAGPIFTQVGDLTGVGALPGMSVKTGRDGTFKVTGVPEGRPVWLSAETAHMALRAIWGPRPFGLWISGTLDLQGVSAGQGKVVLRLAPKALISGRVTFSDAPVAGANVVLRNVQSSQPAPRTRTDAAGRYSLEVSPGLYSIRASAAADLVCEAKTCAVRSGDAADADMQLCRGVQVVGEVPLQDVDVDSWTVRADIRDPKGSGVPRSFPLRIDDKGRFATHLSPACWDLYASSNIAYATGNVDATAGTAPKPIRVAMNGFERPMQCVQVSGPDGAPVPGAIVVDTFPARADASGRVWLDAYPRRRPLRATSADLGEFGSAAFASGSNRLTITLSRGAPIAGRVVDEHGVGIEGALCTVQVESPPEQPGYRSGYTSWISMYTDASGSYKCGLPGGLRYRLTVGKIGWSWKPTAVAEVPSSGRARVPDVVLTPNDRIATGIVLDAAGLPLPGVPVTAWWISGQGEGGPYRSRTARSDPNGAFVITGLPRGIDVVVWVQDDADFVQSTYEPPQKDLAGLKIVTSRRSPLRPLSFSVGKPLLPPDGLEWVQGESPAAGTGGACVLFATAHDPDCERDAALVGYPPLGGGSGVVVFDAALSTAELKAYVAKLHLTVPVARVKDGADLGWGGTGFFHRCNVKYVPCWSTVDPAGMPAAASPNIPDSMFGTGDLSNRLRYRVGIDGETAAGSAARPIAVGPAGSPPLVDARFYAIGAEGSPRILAVGKLDGRTVVAVDGKGVAKPEDFVVVPLALQAAGGLTGLVSLSTTGPGGDSVFLGHYQVDVVRFGEPNEKIWVRPIGSKVGEIDVSGSKGTVELTDSYSELCFTGRARLVWRQGGAEAEFQNGVQFTLGAKVLVADVDPSGSRMQVRQVK